MRALHKGNEGVRCAREAEKLFCIGFSHRSVRVSLGVSSGPILRAIPTKSLIQPCGELSSEHIQRRAGQAPLEFYARIQLTPQVSYLVFASTRHYRDDP